ncbi:hypothetical protein HYW87_00840 [Candidatus Roizmanbacteria bacterium]|nr:hypothetical protein [Candidatus Roizmanbacteria bacterium]
MSADIEQNAIITIYLLFSHNYVVFSYLAGVVITAFLSIVKPTRFSVIMLLGFLVLLFSFEYDKHMIVPFREQTLKSLITQTPHFRLQKLIDIVIAEILPILFYAIGWILIFLGVIYASIKLKRLERSKSS